MPAAPDLPRAINSLYTAFAAVPRPRHIDGCDCCIDQKGIPALLTKPLRELTPDELSSYASSVFLTVGSEADFRYFLPRILEVAVTQEGWWPDWEVIGRALSDGHWLEWAAQEKVAIIAVLDAAFAERCERKGRLGDGLDGSGLDSLLCCLSLASLDLAPYLARLAARPPAVLALYSWHAKELTAGRLANEFWSDAPKGATQVVNWFRSLEVASIISEAYGVDLHPPR